MGGPLVQVAVARHPHCNLYHIYGHRKTRINIPITKLDIASITIVKYLIFPSLSELVLKVTCNMPTVTSISNCLCVHDCSSRIVYN